MRARLPLLVVIGPTASGKSALALRLAEELNGEILSGDSMQVYRGMDIGTAKPTAAERARVPHHLVDILDIDAPFPRPTSPSAPPQPRGTYAPAAGCPSLRAARGCISNCCCPAAPRRPRPPTPEYGRSILLSPAARATRRFGRACGRWTPKPPPPCIRTTSSASCARWRFTS